MLAQVKLQIQAANNSKPSSQETIEVTNFISTAIEKALRITHVNASAVDLKSGEPYQPGYFNPAIANSIHHASVMSPAAILGILQSDFADNAEEQITIEPCIIQAYLGDDDDDV